MASGLAVEGLRKTFGDALAVSLSLVVPEGELFALLGASGSGKTSFLRCLGGFLAPDAGRVVLDGADITALPPHRRPISTMFQSYALFPHMSVAENIGFGPRRAGLSRDAVAARVAEMLALTRLEGFAHRRPGQLSGGQQQRVALARSLAPRPRLLLLDEPFSALDPQLRAATRAEMAALQRSLGQTMVLVTHDQEEAFFLAERIGILRAGRLAQVGTPAELYERPASRFVAEFLGAANILAPRDGLVAAVNIPAPRFVAIRPERLRLGGDGENRFAGEVVGLSYAGATLNLTLALAGGERLRVAHPLGGGLAAAGVGLGEIVTVSCGADACVLLAE